MSDYFEVLYSGKSYHLENKWHKLSRRAIEWAIENFEDGSFNTLSDALEWVEGE